jgi:hypothetical protein
MSVDRELLQELNFTPKKKLRLCGTCVKNFEVWLDPSHYTPATIMVNTTATSFKITVRQCLPQGKELDEWEESREPCDAIAGLGIFRAYGLPPP